GEPSHCSTLGKNRRTKEPSHCSILGKNRETREPSPCLLCFRKGLEMKKLLGVYALLVFAFLLYLVDFQSREAIATQNASKGLHGDMDEKCVMVTFQAGIGYWKQILRGFEGAGETLDVSVECRGGGKYY